MRFRALTRGEIIQEKDYVANEETFEQLKDTDLSIGQRWYKTVYYPMYRIVPDVQ